MNFKNKTLLITGGTGSFGKIMLKHFLGTDISEIKILSRDEKKQEDLRNEINDSRVNYIIGDVRDYQVVHHSCSGVNYVFQAAALKQVPSCEFNPLEAVKTNILGSDNVLNAAISNKVERVVVLSTDKAVYPINAMGISKAMMEKISIAKAREESLKKEGSIISITRYGNVLCSRGSVVPFFVEQILSGRPITITNKEMTRFIMSLDESVSLVLKSFTDAKYGDILVQKSPATTVENIALALLKIFQSDTNIEVIGSRHGEKLHETLCATEEIVKAEELDYYYRIPADLRELNYKTYISQEDLDLNLPPYDSSNTEQLTVEQVEDILLDQPYIKNCLKDL